jgi:predicted phosphodiesterase
MRLAIVADIHGNLPALEAVAADLARHQVDAIVDLGDCVSGPLWPRETAEFLMVRGWPTVRGNHDRVVALASGGALGPSDAFARSQMNARQLAWCGTLPSAVTLPGGILAVHGRPGSDTAYLLEDVEAGRTVPARLNRIEERLAGIDASIVLCGHSHLATALRLPRGTWVVNPGSVGCPAYDDDTPPAHVSEAGSPAARYAVLKINHAGVAVDLVSVPYDHVSASRRAERNGRADWAHALLTGFSTAS